MKKYYNWIRSAIVILLVFLFIMTKHGNDIASLLYKSTNGGNSCGYQCLEAYGIDFYNNIIPPLLLIVLAGLLFQWLMIMLTTTRSLINKTELSDDDVAQNPLTDDLNYFLETKNPTLSKIVMICAVIISVVFLIFWMFLTLNIRF